MGVSPNLVKGQSTGIGKADLWDIPHMSETIATLIEDLMRKRGMTARGLALGAGLNATAVRDILNGRSAKPRKETLINIAMALSVPLAQIIPETERIKYMVDIAAAGGMDARREQALDKFNKAKIAGHVLFGDLSSVDMSGANLAGASFVGARLVGANLSKADLSFTNFTGCDLRGANFEDAVFDQTVFTGADLSNANFAGVDLSKAIFVGGRLDKGSSPKDP